jgi:hypothetical protein
MGRLFATVNAALLATALIAPAPVLAEFKLSKPQAQPQPRPAQPSRPRPARRPRAEPTAAAEVIPEPVTGIDPALMQEAVVDAKYRVTLERDVAAHTAVLHATDGKSGWSVNFKDCVQENRCGSMEFYTLWRTPNEANVCTAWGRDITKDPTRNLGKPFCYTVPTLERQFHLKLSSEQAPYADIPRIPPPQAKERMQTMIGTWAEYLPKLQQAYVIATGKCPRGRCS